MKDKIHPKVYNVCFLDTASGSKFLTTSTSKSDTTETINGVEYYVIKVETSSKSHPFYTGTQKTTQKGGQVDKFLAKVKKAQAAKEAQVKKVKKDEDEE